MLTEDCFLPPLVQLSKPASFLTSIGFHWDASTSQMVKAEGSQLFLHKITTRFHALLLLLVLLQTASFSENENFSKMIIAAFGLIVIVFCGITVQVYHRYVNRCVKLINELIKTSKHLRDGSYVLDTKEKIVKILAPTFHWSAMAVPFAFVGGVVYSIPCMPSNFGYLLLPECSPRMAEQFGNTFSAKILKLAFMLTNLWIWSFGVQCAVFVVIVVMLGAMSIRSFLKFFERIMMSSTKVGSMKGGVLAQNRIVRNSLIYRELQLLTNRFNWIHQLKILVPLLFTVTSHQVFSVYGAIKFHGQLNFVSYALFVILGSQGVLVIMGMFTGLGDVYRMSVRVKGRLEKAHRYHKYLRRFHLACPLIKINFGSVNYIDSFTPLAFENFALMQTTNMLMVD